MTFKDGWLATDKRIGTAGKTISSRDHLRSAEDLAVAKERQRLIRSMLEVQDYYLVDLNGAPAIYHTGEDLDMGEDVVAADGSGRHGRDDRRRDKKSH